MDGSSVEEAGVGRSLDSVSNGGHRCQPNEALAEWRSCEQVENGTPSTSPPYLDIDNDNGDGPKLCELYGKYTWKIDNFSQINKRELRSNVFEVGGYKWYILIYPQGCDVRNHLSLFLCVADHDKLRPGWSHFAQFSIAVVNKDPKKSKYSDTLHRFWKKEHDWGWRKFMELSKVVDGFIDADTLVITSQVQVIREIADQPFRCLDCQYRRELIRVYFTNVEQICRRFVEERRAKLGKLIEDKARWSSFSDFWLEMDPITKSRMSWEKTESILKVVVKHFFIEKEVTSTLVMDSLYSGLKALDGQAIKNDKGKLNDAKEIPTPLISIDNDMFVLVDDVLILLKRVAVEPLPPKDAKGPQNRIKEGCSGEDFTKDSVERDERSLTVLGRRTIETFVLSHIFSKIEVAYQDAVSLKRQEELIREEAASWIAAREQKSKRSVADKEKKSKKKQGKNKQNNRKTKDKGSVDKSSLTVENNIQPASPISEREEYSIEESVAVNAKPSAVGDTSDLSDPIDCVSEELLPDFGDRYESPVRWVTDTSEVNPLVASYTSRVIHSSGVQNELGGKTPSMMDDSSSTCSTDSIQSVVMSVYSNGEHKSQKSVSRGRKQRGKITSLKPDLARSTCNGSSDVGKVSPTKSYKTAASGSQATRLSLSENSKILEQHPAKGEEDQQKRNAKVETVTGRPSQEKTVPLSPSSPSKDPASTGPFMSKRNTNTAVDPIDVRNQVSQCLKQDTESAPLTNSSETNNLVNRSVPFKPLEKPSALLMPAAAKAPEMASASQVPATTRKRESSQCPVMSRPLSAPLIPGSRSAAHVASVVQSTPLLARSVSAVSRLGLEPSSTSQSYSPRSYRNAITGNRGVGISSVHPQSLSTSSAVSSLHSYSQSAAQAPAFSPECSERMGLNTVRPGFSFGMLNQDLLGNGTQSMDNYTMNSGRSIPSDHHSLFSDIWNFDNHHSNSGHILPPDRSSLLKEIRNVDVYSPVRCRSQDNLPSEFPACTSSHQSNAAIGDEFPHLDIINDLLNDDIGIDTGTSTTSSFRSASNGSQHLQRLFSYPGEISMLNDIGPSVSSCRFVRTQSHLGDGYPREYGFLGVPFDNVKDTFHNSISNPWPYENGRINGMIPDQWHMAGSNDQSIPSSRGSENDGYSYYHIPNNSNSGINGYGVYRPSS
ncbi:hypothetical protein Leryth_006332 [Lithospermum erythrorhizon]|nr:hypothetical protein Leryth_006332 [Lithospermum erythrorhizon]